MPRYDHVDPDEVKGGGRARGRFVDTRADDDPDSLTGMMRQAQEEKERKIAPPRINEPRCHVCQHAFRDWIELLLIRGMAYKTIADRVTPPVDRRSISNHYANHMDLQDTAIRAILEQEADLQGRNYQEGVEDAITKRGILEVAVRKGFKDIQDGITTVEPRDLIQMTKLLAEMDSQSSQVAVDEARAQVHIFMLAIQNVCDEDTMDLISNEVAKLRKRENYKTEFETALLPAPDGTDMVINSIDRQLTPEVVDAEVIA